MVWCNAVVVPTFSWLGDAIERQESWDLSCLAHELFSVRRRSRNCRRKLAVSEEENNRILLKIEVEVKQVMLT